MVGKTFLKSSKRDSSVLMGALEVGKNSFFLIAYKLALNIGVVHVKNTLFSIRINDHAL